MKQSYIKKNKTTKYKGKKQPPESSPLAIYTDLVRGYQKEIKKFRDKLFIWRQISGKIQTFQEQANNKATRTGFCGYHVNHDRLNNGWVSLAEFIGGKIGFKGLAACASFWRCPVCSFKISDSRKESVYDVSKNIEKKGYKAYFLTLTIKHDRKDYLGDLLTFLNGSFTKMQRQKYWSRLGVVGFIKSLEITRGRFGWHPHLHIMLVVKDFLSDEQQQDIIDKWCERTGGAIEAQDIKQVYDQNGVDDYISKWDMSSELAHGNKKSGGIKPFDLLEQIREGNKDAIALWKEYISATHGKQAFSISKKLRDLMTKEVKTDEEAVQEEVSKVLMRFLLPVWKKVCDNHLQADILNAYEDGGEMAVLDLLNEHIELDVEMLGDIYSVDVTESKTVKYYDIFIDEEIEIGEPDVNHYFDCQSDSCIPDNLRRWGVKMNEGS